MLLKLLKIRIRSVFAGYEKVGASKGKSTGFKVFIGLLTGYAIICFLAVFAVVFYRIGQQLVEQESGYAYFSLVGIMLVILGFVTSVFAAQAQIFEAKDNDLLLCMPIPVPYIIISRVASLLVVELAESLLIGIEAIIVFGIFEKLTALGIILCVIELLFVNFITAVVSTIFAWILAWITSKVHSKSLVTTVATLVMAFGFFRLVAMLEKYLNKMLEENISLGDSMKKSMFVFYCFGKAVEDANVWYCLLFVASCVALFALLVFVLSFFFIRISTTKKGSLKAKNKAISYKPQSVRWSLVKKEIKRFFTNATYMLNTGIGLIVIFFGSIAIVIEKDKIYDLMMQYPQISEHAGIALMFLVMFFCALNAISAPSISLEGDSLWICKSIPVNASDVLLAKGDAHIIICLPFVLFMSLALNLALPMTVPVRLAVFVIPALYTMFIGYIGVIDNLLLPKFDWADESVAVKQSLSVIATMGIGLGVIVTAFIIYFLMSMIPDMDTVFAIMLILALVISVIAQRHYLKNKGAVKFTQL